MGGWRRTRSARDRALRLFFATDVHGSDRCFRKFLAATEVYGAQALVLGGDIAGKALVPFVRRKENYEFVLQSAERTVPIVDYEKAAAHVLFHGFYPIVVGEDDRVRLAEDAKYRETVFLRLISSQIEGWCRLAEERLDRDIPCIITPGNDDPVAIDHVLREAGRIACPEREVVDVGPIRLASLGNVTPTPWNTEREFEEEELHAQIDMLLAGIAPGSRSVVFNFHCPPNDSGLDSAPVLSEDLKPVVRHGQAIVEPVGSRAVREAIEHYQPGVTLHGHIHESQGMTRIGPSVCLNPGSEYSTGVLKGVIVDFNEDGEYLDSLFTSG